MARMRVIKPEFWVSEQIVECSTTARLLFIGLWNFCDDRGVHPLSAKSIKMRVFPADDIEVDPLLDELVENGLIRAFAGPDGKEYLVVTGWNHQKIDKPTYRYPSPDDHSSTTIRRVLGEPSPPELKGVKGKGVKWKGVKGKGVKGKGVKGSGVDISPSALVENESRPIDSPTPNEEAVEVSEVTPFDDFWEAYPRKVGRASAMKAWKGKHDKLLPTLLQNIKARLACGEWSIDPEQRKFIPHASTYLNGSRWEDEMERGGHERINQGGYSGGSRRTEGVADRQARFAREFEAKRDADGRQDYEPVVAGDGGDLCRVVG